MTRRDAGPIRVQTMGWKGWLTTLLVVVVTSHLLQPTFARWVKKL